MPLDKDDSIAQINNLFPDNTTGEISPADQRIVSSNSISSNLNLIDAGPQIATGSASLSTKQVGVNDLSHLPIPSGGIITLADDTLYFFGNDIDLGVNRLAPGNNTVLGSLDDQVVTLTSSTTESLINSVNKSYTLKYIAFNCPNGTFITATDVSPLTSSFIQLENVAVKNCVNAGVLTSVALFSTVVVRFDNITGTGLVFLGPCGNISFNLSLGVVNSGTFMDLGSATFNGVDANAFRIVGAPGTFAFSGLVDSGNINAGGIGAIRNGRFNGSVTPLNNISINDALWTFLGNDDIADSRPDGLLSQTDNGIETIITTINTPVLLSGVWEIIRSSQFIGTTNGRLTYVGGRPIVVPVVLATTAAAVSGVNKDVNFYIGLNGSIIPSSKVKTNLSAGDTKNQSNIWQLEFQPNDFIEGFVENTTDTINILVEDIKLRIN